MQFLEPRNVLTHWSVSLWGWLTHLVVVVVVVNPLHSATSASWSLRPLSSGSLTDPSVPAWCWSQGSKINDGCHEDCGRIEDRMETGDSPDLFHSYIQPLLFFFHFPLSFYSSIIIFFFFLYFFHFFSSRPKKLFVFIFYFLSLNVNIVGLY